MKRVLLLSVAASALAVPAAALAADASPHTLTGNVGLFSDYRFRGISQTFKEPAIQGGFDYSHASGLYLGTWASNVYGNGAATGAPIYAGGSMEWDFYGGYKFEAIRDVTLDLGLLQYYYPNARYLVPSKEKYDYVEAYLAGSWKWLTVKYSVGLTNYFGLNSETNTALNCGIPAQASCQAANGNSKGSGYFDLTATYEIMAKTNLVAHVGHQSVRHYDKYDYTDWKLGVTREWAGLTFGVAYIDTNAKQAFYTVAEPDGSGGVKTKKLGEGTLVVSVSKTF
jgi:uncharacterized protein (TIGR02001 family)